MQDDIETRYLNERSNHVTRHFPTALGVDDLMQRLEVCRAAAGCHNRKHALRRCVCATARRDSHSLSIAVGAAPAALPRRQ